MPAIILFSLLSLLFGSEEAEIVFAGDAMMHKAQIEAAARPGGVFDFKEYFSSVDDYFTTADYAVVNLETPVAGAPYSGYPCFNAPDAFVDALSEAGFDLFLTANNHTLDRHGHGLIKTTALLDSLGLDHIGTYARPATRDSVMPFIKEINGMRIGFLNYTYGTNGIRPSGNVVVDYIDRQLVSNDVASAREAGAELLIACVHWGVEYNLLPHPEQTSLARYLGQLGVDVVIGGHPHVVQPMEMTEKESGDRHLLVYSLGNFISNMKTRDTRGGAVVRIKIARDDDGKVRLKDASYRLVFTEPADSHHNFRLKWADVSRDDRAREFSRTARDLFMRHNKGITEDKPHRTHHIIESCSAD